VAFPESEVLAQKQEIYHFCHHPRRQVDQSLIQMKFEALLADGTGTNEDHWNLSKWSCYESLERPSLLNHITDCLLENRIPVAQYYPLENVLLLALHHQVVQDAPVTEKFTGSLRTRLGLSNYIEHLAPINVREVVKREKTGFASAIRPISPENVVAYDIGDYFYNMDIDQTQIFPGDDCVLTSHVVQQTEASPVAILTLQNVSFLPLVTYMYWNN
jgi:hypothetical protein